MIRADEYNETIGNIQARAVSGMTDRMGRQAVILCKVVDELEPTVTCVATDGQNDGPVQFPVWKPIYLRGSITGAYSAGDLIFVGADMIYDDGAVRFRDLNVDGRTVAGFGPEPINPQDIGPNTYSILIEPFHLFSGSISVDFMLASSGQPTVGGLGLADPGPGDPEFIPAIGRQSFNSPLSVGQITPAIYNSEAEPQPAPIWFEIEHLIPYALGTARPDAQPQRETIYALPQSIQHTRVEELSQFSAGRLISANRWQVTFTMETPMLHNHKYIIRMRVRGTPDIGGAVLFYLKAGSENIFSKSGSFSASKLTYAAADEWRDAEVEFWYY